MVNLSARIKNFFKNRNGTRGRSGASGASQASAQSPPREPEVLNAQVELDGQLYNIRVKPKPYNKLGLTETGQTANLDSSQIKLHARNGAIAIYSITQVDNSESIQEGQSAATPTFEMVLEVMALDGLEITLLTSNQAEVVEAHLKGYGMTVLNGFVPYLVETGRSSAFKNVVDLLEILTSNSTWTLHHFAAYFNWESHFLSLKKNVLLPEVLAEELQNAANPQKWSVLHVAVNCASAAVVEAIIASGVDVHMVDANGCTVMHYALSGKDDAIVAFLLQKPAFFAQLRALDNKGNTPLQGAFLKEDPCLEVVRCLLAKGLTAKMLSIDPPADKVGVTAPHYLVAKDATPYVTFTEEELNNGFAVNEFSLGGNPLHWTNDFALLERLLHLSAFRVNGRNKLNDTPLICFIKRLAAQEAAQGNLDSTFLKITRIASPAVKKTTVKGKSRAKGGGGTPLKKEGFKSTGAAAWRALAATRRHSHYRLSWILKLLTAGGRVNSQNALGRTALYYAVQGHDIATVQALIIFGARLNLRDQDNVSVLHLAASQLKAIQEEEKKGKQFKGKSSKKGSKKTPKNSNLKETARTKQHFTTIAQILVESGARRCPPGSGSKTPKGVCGAECSQKGGTSTNSVKSVSVKVDIRPVDDHCRLNIAESGQRSTQKQVPQPPPLKRRASERETGSSASLSPSTSTASIAAEGEASTTANASPTPSLFKTPKEEAEDEIEVKSSQPETSTTNQVALEQTPSKAPPKQAPPKSVNMLVLDGGDSNAGIRPLIQALILNELDNYLSRPLHAYFSIVSGVSFGATSGAMLSTRRTAAQAFYFFLRLKEGFKVPVLGNMPSNSARLEAALKKEFGGSENGLKLGEVSSYYGKHLLVFSTLVDREPVVQTVFSSVPYKGYVYSNAVALNETPTSSSKIEPHEKHLWWACRAASCGLYCYSTYEGHYDGGMHASNPTIDTLTLYEAHRAELKAASQQGTSTENGTSPPPVNLVLSIGCGSRPVQLDVLYDDYDKGGVLTQIYNKTAYYRQLRDVILAVVTQQNGFIADRAAAWAGSINATYSRLNFTFTKNKGEGPLPGASTSASATSRSDRTYLSKVTAGTLRSAPSAPIVDGDGHLLQTLWAVKMQMLARKSVFVRLAKELEKWINEVEKQK